MKTFWNNVKAFAFKAAHKQWYIVLVFVLFVLSVWYYGYVLSAITGPLMIVLLFWLGLVQFKMVKDPEKEKKK